MTVSLTPKAKIPPYLPDRNNYQATHEGLHVEFGKEGEEFNSCLKADKVSLSNLYGILQLRASPSKSITALREGREAA